MDYSFAKFCSFPRFLFYLFRSVLKYQSKYSVSSDFLKLKSSKFEKIVADSEIITALILELKLSFTFLAVQL